MAGFGGMFNYEKPGPGVDKHAPKKTGIALFFSIFTRKFWNMIPLSLLYVLLCLPVVTIGLADVGITYITRNFAREKPVFLVSDFFSTIKKNWKQALLVGILNLLLTAILIFALWFYYQVWNERFFFKVGFVITGCIFIVYTFLKYYINILIVTFDLNIKQLYKNSLLLSSAGLKENVIITVALFLLYTFFFGIPFAWMLILEDMLLPIIFMLLTVLFFPAIQSLIIQFCVFPVVKKHMIDPYYEAHPEAKNDKALLNLLDEEESEEEDMIFKDRGTQEESVKKGDLNIPKQYSKREIRDIRHQRDNDDTI